MTPARGSVSGLCAWLIAGREGDGGGGGGRPCAFKEEGTAPLSQADPVGSTSLPPGELGGHLYGIHCPEEGDLCVGLKYSTPSARLPPRAALGCTVRAFEGNEVKQAVLSLKALKASVGGGGGVGWRVAREQRGMDLPRAGVSRPAWLLGQRLPLRTPVCNERGNSRLMSRLRGSTGLQ